MELSNVIIRHAALSDLKQIEEMESACFPKNEAASLDSFQKRLETYPNHFWLMEKDGMIVSGINGLVANTATLTDEMFAHPELHDENGMWQMIFGVTTLPEYQGKGYASMLMRRVIDDCSAQGRKGIVLTCKEKLIPFYEQFGYQNQGLSHSEHGGATWYEMRLLYTDTDQTPPIKPAQ